MKGSLFLPILALAAALPADAEYRSRIVGRVDNGRRIAVIDQYNNRSRAATYPVAGPRTPYITILQDQHRRGEGNVIVQSPQNGSKAVRYGDLAEEIRRAQKRVELLKQQKRFLYLGR